MNRSTSSYRGKRVFVGIDVHRKSYTITCISNGELIKRCHLPAEPAALVDFCRKQFPGATISSAYEGLCCTNR